MWISLYVSLSLSLPGWIQSQQTRICMQQHDQLLRSIKFSVHVVTLERTNGEFVSVKQLIVHLVIGGERRDAQILCASRAQFGLASNIQAFMH